MTRDRTLSDGKMRSEVPRSFLGSSKKSRGLQEREAGTGAVPSASTAYPRVRLTCHGSRGDQ